MRRGTTGLKGPAACAIDGSTQMARPSVRYATTADGLEIELRGGDVSGLSANGGGHGREP
jgi:hypothetical protein